MIRRARTALGAWTDELVVAFALVLIAAGCWHVWRPGAYLVPGAVILWLALPTRRAFIDRETPAPRARRQGGRD